MNDSSLSDLVASICLALPDVTERLSHGAPTYFVRDKKSFATGWYDGHHGVTFPQPWCAGPEGAQAALVATEPARFFRPPYVGHRGWIGVRLDFDLDVIELEAICRDAYRTVAPAKLLAALDAEPSS